MMTALADDSGQGGQKGLTDDSTKVVEDSGQDGRGSLGQGLELRWLKTLVSSTWAKHSRASEIGLSSQTCGKLGSQRLWKNGLADECLVEDSGQSDQGWLDQGIG